MTAASRLGYNRYGIAANVLGRGGSMIQYLRIPKNKFWGWVFASLAVGLLIGAGCAWAITRASSSKESDDLRQQLTTQASEASASLQSVQSRLDSVTASLTALSAENTQLKADAAAKKSSSDKTSSSSTSTETATLEVLSRTISPSDIATGDYITMTATAQGDATKVTMKLYSTDGSFSHTYSLKKSSTDGQKSTWKLVTRGPKAVGTYHYYATVYSDSSSATAPSEKQPGTLKVEKH
jgi:hypothetical protein